MSLYRKRRANFFWIYSMPELIVEEGTANKNKLKILYKNSEKLLLTIALTTLPFTSASQILIKVRNTSKIVSK